MIHSVTADRPSFKSIEFKPGFNVILAERTKESTKKDSRNGLGKSTLIEIIHFCLGSSKGETLSKKELKGWTFTLDLDLGGKRYKVSRINEARTKIIIEGDCSNWPIKPEIDKKTGQKVIGIQDWRRVLGVLMFGLQLSYPDYKYSPSFGSLISYFVRRDGGRGGFLNPFQHFKAQLEWDKQIHNSFLLNLNWEYASNWQVLKDRLKVITQIRQEAQEGLLTKMLGSTGEVEAQKIRLETEIRDEEKLIQEFKVHPQYREIENEVNNITTQIHERSNMNISDKQVLEHYEESLKEENDAEPQAVLKMFEEAGFVLPGSINKKLQDVISFHKQVVTNRRDFLNSEMEKIGIKIAEREKKIKELSSERAEKMKILQKHGALDEYGAIQNKHQTKVAQLKDLNIRLENLKKFDKGKESIEMDQAILQRQARTDLGERKSQRETAVLLFNSNSNALYEAPGTLSIDVTKTGYKFNVEIERSGSHGIGNMKIFCYDLMFAQMWADKVPNQMFFIHDSILFADVDERQKALALELAAKESEKQGFQYICTLNSDTLPERDFSKDFKLYDYVRQTFTDAAEDGALLGIRF